MSVTDRVAICITTGYYKDDSESVAGLRALANCEDPRRLVPRMNKLRNKKQLSLSLYIYTYIHIYWAYEKSFAVSRLRGHLPPGPATVSEEPAQA